jgi:hypothetical protein
LLLNSDRIDVVTSIGVYDNGLLVRVGFFLLKFLSCEGARYVH